MKEDIKKKFFSVKEELPRENEDAAGLRFISRRMLRQKKKKLTRVTRDLSYLGIYASRSLIGCFSTGEDCDESSNDRDNACGDS